MCKLCARNGAVLPGIEAFEMGVEIPTVYFLFYDYFYKCSVGDQRWKKACREEDDLSAPMGPPQAEAFAMMQLKNNYFAWLLEAKEQLSDVLITDYDPDTRRTGRKSVAEVYMKKMEVDVGGGQEDDVIVPETHSKYEALKKQTDESIKKARRASKNNMMYKEVKKELDAWRREGEAEQEETELQTEEERRGEKQRKRRKILRTFREYTVRQNKEGKFKGWSSRASGDMAALCKKLREGKEEYRRFRMAYHEIYSSRNQNKRKEQENALLQVDYNELWDVGEIPQIEI
jgi:hypothetical protein